jgi:hypothetical protein
MSYIAGDFVHCQQQLIDWVATRNRSEYVFRQYETELPFQKIEFSDFWLKYPYHLPTVISDARDVSRIGCIINDMCKIILLLNYHCEGTLLSSSEDRVVFSSKKKFIFCSFFTLFWDECMTSVRFQLHFRWSNIFL